MNMINLLCSAGIGSVAVISIIIALAMIIGLIVLVGMYVYAQILKNHHNKKIAEKNKENIKTEYEENLEDSSLENESENEEK